MPRIYDETITPREIIPDVNDIQRRWNAWCDAGTGEPIIDNVGRSTGYELRRNMRDYAYEGRSAWDYNMLHNSSSSRMAQAFWIAMQQQYIATRRPLDHVMTPEEAERFRYWNREIAGQRSYGMAHLPWTNVNEQLLATGRMEQSGRMADLVEAARKDLAKFWIWHAQNSKPEEPFVPNPDGTLDVRDPRVRHLWVKAAEVARAQSMCGSYDVIAREVGVPDRATLKRTGELKAQIKITWRGGDLVKTFDRDADNNTYQQIDKKITGADIRAMLMEMSDQDLRSRFSVYDASNLD